MPPSAVAPPALQEATRHATVTWQDDLKALFDRAKDRFPDVVWELLNEHDSSALNGAEEVWGHKAVVYARAPPSFQARYFSFKPAPLPSSPLPYSSSPTGTLPAQSALSLTLGVDFTSVSRSPSPFRAPSPSPSTGTGAVLRIPIAINPILFSNELEYLYTGKGFGEAFEFLFDSTASREEGDEEEARIDKLRKDLVFMWRSRLYSDIRISLTGIFSSTNHEPTTAIFSSHRFMLVSRSDYFRTQLQDWADSLKPSSEPLTVTLPSPPFTPASLHFTLGFIYTGTLAFSNRTFDLDTAFHIMRSASYLSIDTLYDEIQARIVQEMMHGLFHAFLEFSEYEAATGGKWGTGGCRCRQCARRAPRVLEFAISEDVKNPHLERGARRALVGLFGEGWCITEFAHLPQKTRDAIVKGLAKRTTPMNIFPLLFASHAALARLGTIIDNWSDTVKDMVLTARKTIDEVMCSQADQCFEQPEWLDIMESDGVRFEDGERVEWAMDSIRRGLNEKNAAALYQTLVSAVLLRPHPTEPDQAMLSATSHVRVSVEQARVDILRWLRRRYLNVKQEGGFDCLEPWAAKEIASELELSVDDMFSPVSPSAAPRGTGRVGPRVSVAKAEDETGSMHSLRTGLHSQSTTSRATDAVKSSNASSRSVARSTLSMTSRTSTVTTTRRLALSTGRPDSKLTPSHVTSPPSVRSGLTSNGPAPSLSSRASLSPVPGRRNVSSHLAPGDRASKVRSSAASVKSQASTIRKVSPAGSSALRPSSALSGRPSSTMSNNTSDGSTAFETAKTDITPVTARSRRGSTASSVSNLSVRTTGTSRTNATSTPRLPRSRAPSTASKPSTPLKKRPPPSPVDSRTSPAARRTASSTSVRSTASTSPAAPRRTVSRQPSGASSVRSIVAKDGSGTVKGKGRLGANATHEKQASVVSTSSAATVKESLKRKSSSDTIKEASTPQLPRGATLDIGIPCIISSKKARFRAFARYIGEVEGELGPWVGVEVPMNDTWPGEKLEGRAWHDGTWGGIRYFDIGASNDWDYDDDRAARRRKFDWASSGKGTLKREGDQLSIDRAKRLRSVSPVASDVSNSESRGLFVRPQQVLYVVDAVGSDL
ncbi:uncharacterized protein C8Q71DRAFT_909620 [Rhodofomes roseus]|uniref:CAP-Gly domain-containing protein n=1 Tax=Rhodofomes roseus TaxID=34475 RepID=A0ABQ8K7S9_9APHY|nr:uncharacterized protein C8Q71DRAFT_909620 [Rhodofomes roseus]KAH9833107.1 hypothetical protein C8Q71DRAFT_909620 [Rhodofomes roseus]